MLAHVGCGEHRVHAPQRTRSDGVDGPNLGVRVRTAEECRMQHAVVANVADEATSAGQQGAVFLPRYGSAERLSAHNASPREPAQSTGLYGQSSASRNTGRR
jgi:hypothetical protein